MKLKKIVLLLLVLSLVSVSVFAVEVEESEESEEIVAVVGGQEISSTQLEQYANIQQLLSQIAQTDQGFAQLIASTDQGEELLNEYKKMKLDGLIDETVLQVEAKNRNISLTQEEKDQEFDSYIQQIKDSNDMTDEDILDTLKQQGIESLEQYKDLFLADPGLKINKLLEEEVFSQINVSDQEVEKYYEDNQEQINQPLSDIEEDLKDNIKMQKQQAALQEFIEDVKSDMDIEKHL